MSCCAGLNPVNDLRYYNSCVLQSLPLYSFTFIPFCLSIVIILLYDFSKFPVTLCPQKAFWEGFCQAGLLGCTDFVPQILLKKTPWPVYKLFAVITGSSHILALLAWGATIYNTQIISKIMDWKVICQVVVTFLSLSQTESFVACMKLVGGRIRSNYSFNYCKTRCLKFVVHQTSPWCWICISWGCTSSTVHILHLLDHFSPEHLPCFAHSGARSENRPLLGLVPPQSEPHKSMLLRVISNML